MARGSLGLFTCSNKWSQTERYGPAKSSSAPTNVTLLAGFLFVVAALPTGAVSLGRVIDFWDTLTIVTVSVWIVSSGLGLLLNLADFLQKDGEFKRAGAVLTPAAIISALMKIAILPFWWEFALFPCLGILSILFAHHDSKDQGHPLYKSAKTARCHIPFWWWP